MHPFATWLTSAALAGAATLVPPASPGETTLPAPPTSAEGHEVLFIRAGKLYVTPKNHLENAQVIVEEGRIVAVGDDLSKPDGARELAGAVVCAGFIDPWSRLGLDSGAVDDKRTSVASQSVDALDLYGGDHERTEALKAGVTAVRVQAGIQSAFGGVGAIVRLAPGLTREAAVILGESSVGATLGISTGTQPVDVFDRIGAVDKLASEIESGRKYREDLVEHKYELDEWRKGILEKEEELEKDFKKAKKDRDKKKKEAEEKGKEFKEKKYKEDKKPKAPKFDADKEVMARVADGELPLVVEAHRAGEIRELLAVTEPFDRVRLILAGATESAMFAKKLAERRIPVLLWPALHGTSTRDELSGHDLSTASRLSSAGVQVLLGSGGASNATRDLPLLAGLAIGHGLDRMEAFEALTTGAAQAFDVADRIGSIERGKDADLLILDGEPLVSTTRIQYVVAGGEVVVTPEN